MEAREQIEEKYRVKQSQLMKERDEEIRKNQEEKAAIRKPIDDEYWQKREPLDAEWKTKLRKAGIT